MRIGIINNAANYLYFNVNLARYLKMWRHDVVFLNTDRFIRKYLLQSGLNAPKYPKIKKQERINYYGENSELIRYYARLYKTRNIISLIQEKNKEYNSAYQYLRQESFDYILILNGAFSVETDICKQLGIRCFFFEHGYFPKTIQMNRQGVNSRAEYADLPLDEIMEFSYVQNTFDPVEGFEFINIRYPKITRYYYRMTDSGYMSFMHKYLQRKIRQQRAKRRFERLEDTVPGISLKDTYVFWPLQVNSDTQIVLNSPYNSMYEALEKVLPELVKAGYKVILKEHPLEVEPVIYTEFADNENVFLLAKYDINTLTDNAAFVVNINSSVGMQAIARHAKVLLLGDAFYWSAPNCVQAQLRDIPAAVKKLRDMKLSEPDIDEYIRNFKENIFIPGHFYTPDTALLERIRNRLI